MSNQEAIKWLREAEILDLASGNTKDREAVDMAISALEKQIPKKIIPNVGLINPAWVEDAYLCPVCFSWAGLTGYCSKCGQAIDWTESE